MNDGSRHDSAPKDPVAPQAPALELTALQRRRLLLRGVGKGGAVLAAAVPLASFANAPLLKTAAANGAPRLCTVSGMGSAMHSGTPSAGTCSGKTAAYWHDPSRTWPTCTVAAGKSLSRTTRWQEIFGGSTSRISLMTCEQLMAAPAVDMSKQTWVRALLNAADGYPASFPYMPTEVMSLYTSNRVAAEQFFTNWV